MKPTYKRIKNNFVRTPRVITEALLTNEKILGYIKEMKQKSIVHIGDLEKYYDLLNSLDRDIRRLIESRDKWKHKYQELKKHG